MAQHRGLTGHMTQPRRRHSGKHSLEGSHTGAILRSLRGELLRGRLGLLRVCRDERIGKKIGAWIYGHGRSLLAMPPIRLVRVPPSSCPSPRVEKGRCFFLSPDGEAQPISLSAWEEGGVR